MNQRVRRMLQGAARASRQLRPGVTGGIAIVLVAIFAGTIGVVTHAVAQSSPNLPISTRALNAANRPTAVKPAVAKTRQPHVRMPRGLISATMLARQNHTLTKQQLVELREISGVEHVTRVSAGHAVVDNHKANLLGVNPGSFRAWTPKLTARSNPLWDSIASGDLTASFDMGHGAKLPLGSDVPVYSKNKQTMRIGAFASVGLAGVDAVVNGARSQALGLPNHNAVVISAPHADPLVLKAAVSRVLNKGAAATLLREVIVVREAGEFMTNSQISIILHAAASRIGKPYVWGATGPNSFDCSGLVLWSFAHAGIHMPRVAADQFFAGPHIPYADARPGDLLFWHYDPTDPTDVDHTAIYAGNGMMIVAPHTGLDVEYVPVPLDHLAGVVRVDPAVADEVG